MLYTERMPTGVSRSRAEGRSTRSTARSYRMSRRASQVDETRLRITEAAVRLHTTVGPSETSFAAVAQAAGVTRLTLYRHFADRDELFAACMGHWRAQHPAPDVDAWRGPRSIEGRVRRAIGELYAWYTRTWRRPLPALSRRRVHPGNDSRRAPPEPRTHDRCHCRRLPRRASRRSQNHPQGGCQSRARVLDLALARGRRGLHGAGSG